MMKKTIILLSSVLASALVVGGAFAAYAYAVTDNAGTLTVDVTPGELEIDQTKYVTLEWGQSTALSNLGNIKLNTNYKVGAVELKASINYTGIFSATITDTTERATNFEGEKLIDYLNVYVYQDDKNLDNEGALPADDPFFESVYSADPEEEKLLGFEEEIACTAGEGQVFSFFVNVDNAAAKYFTSMTNDNVRITVDWNQGEGTILSSRVVYFSRQSGWTSDMHLYAFGANGENSPWPGVAMDQVNDDLYRIVVPSQFDTLIFNDGTGTGGGHQTAEAGIKFDGYGSSAQYYDLSKKAWTDLPTQKAYYLVGRIGGNTEWVTSNQYPLVVNPGNPYEFMIEHVALTRGDTVKVARFDGVTCGDNDYAWAGDDLTVPYSGKYTLYFSPEAQEAKATQYEGENVRYSLDGFPFAGHIWAIPEEFAMIELTFNPGTYGDGAALFIRSWSDNGEEAFGTIAEGKATILKDAVGLLVLKNKAGTTSPVWEGENYIGQSANLEYSSQTTLAYSGTGSAFVLS